MTKGWQGWQKDDKRMTKGWQGWQKDDIYNLIKMVFSAYYIKTTYKQICQISDDNK